MERMVITVENDEDNVMFCKLLDMPEALGLVDDCLERHMPTAPTQESVTLQRPEFDAMALLCVAALTFLDAVRKEIREKVRSN